MSSKSETCTESLYVYAADISVKVSAQYPGRSATLLSELQWAERRLEEVAEVSRGHSSSIRPERRPELEVTDWRLKFR
jgi:hypothetical protein